MNRLAFGLVAVLAAPPVVAEDYWEFGDWRVYVEVSQTLEHTVRTCAALTGGDGLPSLNLEVNNLDAGPPTDYPEPFLLENAPRGNSTQVQNGQAVGFVVDGQAAFYGIANGYSDENGFLFARVEPRWQDTVNMLKWMKVGQNIDIRTVHPYGAGEQVLLVSLKGFSAAYGKMMDECGFSLSLDG